MSAISIINGLRRSARACEDEGLAEIIEQSATKRQMTSIETRKKFIESLFWSEWGALDLAAISILESLLLVGDAPLTFVRLYGRSQNQ